MRMSCGHTHYDKVQLKVL